MRKHILLSLLSLIMAINFVGNVGAVKRKRKEKQQNEYEKVHKKRKLDNKPDELTLSWEDILLDNEPTGPNKPATIKDLEEEIEKSGLYKSPNTND